MLTQSLRTILEEVKAELPGEVVQPLSIAEQLKEAVENSQPNQVFLARKFMEWLTDQLNGLAPNFPTQADLNKLLIQALAPTVDLVQEFAQIAEVIATTRAVEVAHTLYKGFELLIEKYNLPRGFSGSFRDIDFDYYKFLGHELFVTLFSFLIREKQWGFCWVMLS